MSERAYEDGTPAAYEPKVEPWMQNVGEEAWQRELVCRNEAPHIARLIAKHAPKPEPQPIRRGDVVQVIEPRVSPSLFGTIFTVTETDGSYIRDVPTLLPTRMPMSWVVRIGRARYYPDGTPVED